MDDVFINCCIMLANFFDCYFRISIEGRHDATLNKKKTRTSKSNDVENFIEDPDFINFQNNDIHNVNTRNSEIRTSLHISDDSGAMIKMIEKKIGVQSLVMFTWPLHMSACTCAHSVEYHSFSSEDSFWQKTTSQQDFDCMCMLFLQNTTDVPHHIAHDHDESQCNVVEEGLRYRPLSTHNCTHDGSRDYARRRIRSN